MGGLEPPRYCLRTTILFLRFIIVQIVRSKVVAYLIHFCPWFLLLPSRKAARYLRLSWYGISHGLAVYASHTHYHASAGNLGSWHHTHRTDWLPPT